MAGSDGPDPYVFPGFSLHDELEWLVKSGFTPLQALQSATFNPALFHGPRWTSTGWWSRSAWPIWCCWTRTRSRTSATRARFLGWWSSGKYYSRHDLDTMLQQVEKLAAQE